MFKEYLVESVSELKSICARNIFLQGLFEAYKQSSLVAMVADCLRREFRLFSMGLYVRTTTGHHMSGVSYQQFEVQEVVSLRGATHLWQPNLATITIIILKVRIFPVIFLNTCMMH